MHTPGPWIADGPAENIHILVEAHPHMRVCFMASDGPTKANARLIAAAPDMLYAIEQLIDGAAYDGQIKTHDHTLRMLVNAYTKATGCRPPL